MKSAAPDPIIKLARPLRIAAVSFQREWDVWTVTQTNLNLNEACLLEFLQKGLPPASTPRESSPMASFPGERSLVRGQKPNGHSILPSPQTRPL
ncbi:MAG: hypothetical protein IPK79_11935 [Vampirovibrionales bacterium]|nr:hypothetical protein [Vampirovibrionales bacterium]